MQKTNLLLSTAVLFACIMNLTAQDWPQYLGPDRNSTSPQKGILRTMRAPLFDKGSMILADGVIIATDGRKSLYVIEPSPEGFKQLATAEVLTEGGTAGNDPMAPRVGGSTQNWAPIALADGKLLLRDQTRLLCVRVAK